MKIDNYFDEISNELDDIHATLFGGEANISDLDKALGDLNMIANKVKKLKDDLDMSNILMNKIIKLFQLFFYILAAIMFTMSFLGVNFLISTLFASLDIYIARKIKKEYQKDDFQEIMDERINKLFANIGYKKEITNKKITNLKRRKGLELSFSSKEEIPRVPKIQLVRTRTRSLQ